MTMAADPLAAIIARLEPATRAAFEAAIADIRSAAQLQAIIAHLTAGNVEAAIVALNLRAEFFAPLDDAIRAAYLAGGASALAGFPPVPVPFLVALASSFALTDGTSAPNESRGTSAAD